MTIKQITAQIRRELLPGRMMDHVAHLALYHRTQASSGYLDAANWVVNRWKEMGVDATALEYQARSNTYFFEAQSFQQWECRGGRLELVVPKSEILGDYEDCALSVMIRSAGVDFCTEPLEVVSLEEGCTEEECLDDLSGKIVFSTDNPHTIKWAFDKRGAVGMITDRIACFGGFRIPENLLDERGYNSFDYQDSQFVSRPFGFTITVRQGIALRKLCKKMAQENAVDSKRPKYPMVKGYVDAKLFDGHLHNVTAVIPGQTESEILLTAHLCHPKPSANDNCSGVAVVMETVAVLQRLVCTGVLPRPQFTIRALLVPEMTGTYAYLSSLTEEQRSKIKAGLNVDQVGGHQTTNGPICLYRTPEFHSSFANDLAEVILEYIIKTPTSFFETGPDPSYNFQVKNYTGGTDHQILGGASLGIPALNLTQWPAQNYHTSGDTIDKLDPGLMKEVAAVTATWIYSMAALNAQMLPAIFDKAVETYLRSCSQQCAAWREAGEEASRLVQRIGFACGNAKRAIFDVLRFLPDEDGLTKLLKAETARYAAIGEGVVDRTLALADMERHEPVDLDGEFSRIPQRTYTGELTTESLNEYLVLPEYAIVLKNMNPLAADTEYYISGWMDGKRTVAQIALNTSLTGDDVDPTYVMAYIKLLIAAGKAHWVK